VEVIADVICCLMASDFEAEVGLYKYLSLRFGQHNDQHSSIPFRLFKTSIILSKQASTGLVWNPAHVAGLLFLEAVVASMPQIATNSH
jgi:hypothetical protein